MTATTTERKKQKPKRRRSTLARQEARLGWILVLPAALIVLALVLFPVLWNISLSLQKIRLVELRDFGIFDINNPTLDNFARVVATRGFWELTRTTLIYTVGGTVLSMLMGLWAALVVRKAFIGRSLVRGLMLFPYVAPVIAVTFVWRIMLSPSFGVINEWITSGGGSSIDFLGRRSIPVNLLGLEFDIPLALTTVIIFEAWRYFPFAFLFILARVQAMSGELDEAAMVDGATLTQRFWYVTLPQLRGVFSVLFLLRFIWTFNKFDDIFLLTGGSAGTKVITVQIVEWLRGRGDIGAAAALGLVLAAILIILLIIYFKWFYEEDTE